MFLNSFSQDSAVDFTPPSERTKQLQEKRRSTIVLLLLGVLLFAGLIIAAHLAKWVNAEFAQDTIALLSGALR